MRSRPRSQSPPVSRLKRKQPPRATSRPSSGTHNDGAAGSPALIVSVPWSSLRSSQDQCKVAFDPKMQEVAPLSRDSLLHQSAKWGCNPANTLRFLRCRLNDCLRGSLNDCLCLQQSHSYVCVSASPLSHSGATKASRMGQEQLSQNTSGATGSA